jgi:FixJ family two-component response regulator
VLQELMQRFTLELFSECSTILAHRNGGDEMLRMLNAHRNAIPPLPLSTPVVFVVDDDVSTRESLEALILSGGWAAETFACARSFLSRPRARVANCLILDLNLPDLNGLDLQRLISAQRSETPIIFVTGCSDVPIAVKAMKAGACEFMIKPFRSDLLLVAIENCIERSKAELMRRSQIEAMKDRYRSLSHREREVMSLVAAGLLNKQVGFELGISEITVKAHRGRVMRKMNARSLPDLVVAAARLGLLSLY